MPSVMATIWVIAVGFAALHRRMCLSLTCLFVGGLLFASMPNFGDARPAAERNGCINNMKQLALGILGYEAAHGHFPPPYVADADGLPMHSSRISFFPTSVIRTCMTNTGSMSHGMVRTTRSWPSRCRKSTVARRIDCPVNR